MRNLKKLIVTTMAIVSLVSTVAFARSEAIATKNTITTSSIRDNCNEVHGVYHAGHYTAVVRDESGGRTWGLAAVGNPNNTQGNMMISVKIGGDYYGQVSGNKFIQTSTRNKWGSHEVSSYHSEP